MPQFQEGQADKLVRLARIPLDENRTISPEDLAKEAIKNRTVEETLYQLRQELDNARSPLNILPTRLNNLSKEMMGGLNLSAARERLTELVQPLENGNRQMSELYQSMILIKEALEKSDAQTLGLDTPRFRQFVREIEESAKNMRAELGVLEQKAVPLIGVLAGHIQEMEARNSGQ